MKEQYFRYLSTSGAGNVNGQQYNARRFASDVNITDTNTRTVLRPAFKTTPSGKIPLSALVSDPFRTPLGTIFSNSEHAAEPTCTSLDLLSPFYDRVFYNNYKLIMAIVTL